MLLETYWRYEEQRNVHSRWGIVFGIFFFFSFYEQRNVHSRRGIVFGDNFTQILLAATAEHLPD